MTIFTKTAKTRWTWYQWVRLISQFSYLGLMVASVLGRNFVAAIVLMSLAIIGGAFYCGWLCPLGTVQEWLGRIGSRMMGGRRFKVPVRLEKWMMSLRYLLMIAGFTGLAFLVFLGFLSQPYQSFMGLIMQNTAYVSTAAWVLLGLFLALSLMMDRPFCRYFCTEGARYGLLSVARLFSIRRQPSKCTECGICDRKCPTQVTISTKSHVRSPQCINCLECVSSCPADGALDYGWAVNLKKEADRDAT